jgi:uracil-DNA glycosylase
MFWRWDWDPSRVSFTDTDPSVLVHPDGPRDGKIAFVGEAPGKEEDRIKLPFVGESGQELKKMCRDAEIDPGECLFTNVFMQRPPDNKLSEFCYEDRKQCPPGYSTPALGPGLYVREEFLWHLDRLSVELEQFRPNVIVACGNTALWALCGVTGITRHRGAVTTSRMAPTGTKVVPTYHPASVLRSWDQRAIVVVDLMKALRESEYPDIRVPLREIWLDPTIEDLWEFHRQYIEGCEVLSFDIETDFHRPKRPDRLVKAGFYRDWPEPKKDEFISCISLSPSPYVSIVVPFVDRMKPGYAWWDTLEEEVEAWKFLHHVFRRDKPYVLLGQNGIYDIQYLLTEAKVKCWGYRRDTMLRHHAWMPELSKSLGFLGSVYTDEVAWKNLRPKGRAVQKREE